MKKEKESGHKVLCRTIAVMLLALITCGIIMIGVSQASQAKSKSDEVKVQQKLARSQEEVLEEAVKKEMTKAIDDITITRQ